MNETKQTNDLGNSEELPDDVVDANDDEGVTPRRTGLIDRLRNLIDSTAHPASKREMSQDRTRVLVLLIGAVAGAALLFLGLLSTPANRSVTTGRAEPNLGRRGPAVTEEVRQASVVPILSAEPDSELAANDPLGALLGMSREFGQDGQGDSSDTSAPTASGPENRNQSAVSTGNSGLASQGSHESAADLITYRYGAGTGDSRPDRQDSSELSTFSYGGTSADQAVATSSESVLASSSIIFVRSEDSPGVQPATNPPSASAARRPSLLPPGSRLIARLEAAVTTALNAPVVAAIEYNYERGGAIVVPAGARVIGEIRQASANGQVGIDFHTLRMPDGTEEDIRAMAMSLQHGPLEGEVSGQNRLRRVLSRTLSGIGTVAAYVVGAGGTGLGQPITGGTLLRDRLATNIAQAGEQEFVNATASQNVVVTVPAQTRFYVVMEENAVEEGWNITAAGAAAGEGAEASRSILELRELMDLKREIDRLYAESAAGQSLVGP